MKNLLMLLVFIGLFTVKALSQEAKYKVCCAMGEGFITKGEFYKAIQQFNAADACSDKPLPNNLHNRIEYCGEQLEKRYRAAADALQKSDRMVEALMPVEAKRDPFTYFWKNGKRNLKLFNYGQAELQLLMSKEAFNIPKNMIDSAAKMYEQAEAYGKKYRLATGYFYKNEFTEARRYFGEIKDKNRTDSLSLFMYYASGDFATENMVTIPAGKFTMGSPDSIGEIDEHPQQKITINAFKFSKFEVTNAQYARFLNEYTKKYPETDSINRFISTDGKYSGEMRCGIMNDKGIYKVHFGYENRPVAYVSWYGADAFCRFYNLSLPTEAQWEYAARGGQTKNTDLEYAGSNDIDVVAWHDENSSGRTHAVGTKKPNQAGLYDMSGNLWEWCNGWKIKYGESYSENTVNCKDCLYRVFRGGCWLDIPSYLNVAFRGNDRPEYRDYSIGFRVSKSQ